MCYHHGFPASCGLLSADVGRGTGGVGGTMDNVFLGGKGGLVVCKVDLALPCAGGPETDWLGVPRYHPLLHLCWAAIG